MTIEGTRFGAIEFIEEDVVTFSGGLIGFPGARRFVLLSMNPESPFRWLQSVDEAGLAFLVADPARYVADYAPEVSDAVAASLQMDESTPKMVFTTATIPSGRPDLMTLNLAGPLLINAVTRQGAQVVLEDDAYTIGHRVFQAAIQVSESVAA
jgi:flagellar assembly factor FliW